MTIIDVTSGLVFDDADQKSFPRPLHSSVSQSFKNRCVGTDRKSLPRPLHLFVFQSFKSYCVDAVIALMLIEGFFQDHFSKNIFLEFRVIFIQLIE